MTATEVCEGIYKLGVNLPSDILFEGIWPIPTGVSINGYVVKGEKIALIDMVCDFDLVSKEYEAELAKLDISQSSIDYLIVNHMEPDHSGYISKFIKKNPNIKLVCTHKTVPMLASFCDLTKNITAVRSGDELDLGNGKKLTFYETPNVHWPETMMTFEVSSGVLFSCDAFGSYGAVAKNHSFDDCVSEETLKYFEAEALRYYANIVASFSSFVLKAIEQLGSLAIKIIAPSHGLIWRGNPSRIVNLYIRYANYATNHGEKELCLIWGSMYGNTQSALTAVREAATEEGITLHEHRVPDEETGFALASIWRSKGIILAMPSYEYQMFPPVAHVLDDCHRKKMFGKKGLRIGSFGWIGGAEKELKVHMEKLKWVMAPSIEWAGKPSAYEFVAIKEAVKQLAQDVKNE
jgi:anaerobic nitric oxide reductase flavorubredoxin